MKKKKRISQYKEKVPENQKRGESSHLNEGEKNIRKSVIAVEKG